MVVVGGVTIFPAHSDEPQARCIPISAGCLILLKLYIDTLHLNVTIILGFSQTGRLPKPPAYYLDIRVIEPPIPTLCK